MLNNMQNVVSLVWTMRLEVHIRKLSLDLQPNSFIKSESNEKTLNPPRTNIPHL